MVKAYSITRFISGVVYTPVAGQTNTLNFVYRYDRIQCFRRPLLVRAVKICWDTTMLTQPV